MIRYAYVGFGSNLGDRQKNFLLASAELHNIVNVLRTAQIVESVPVDGVEGGNFLNTVFECELFGNAPDYLKELQKIEILVGSKTEKQGTARTCDLDILLWGSEIIDLPNLKIPHPRLKDRDFYLEPLCELIPNEYHPGMNKTFAELLANLEQHSVIGHVSIDNT